MKNLDVARAFVHRVSLSTQHYASREDKLFSYDTCIAQWLNEDTVIINSTKYSNTTSRHLSLMKNQLLGVNYIKYTVTTITVPKGTHDLIQYV